jgi:DNA-binding protein YbaB
VAAGDDTGTPLSRNRTPTSYRGRILILTVIGGQSLFEGQACAVTRGYRSCMEDVLGRLGELRAAGSAANGLVQAEVDGAGRIIGVHLDARAMRLGSQDLAEAVTTALREAQAAAREQGAGVVAMPDREAHDAASARAVEQIERQMHQMVSTLDEIARRTRR